MSAVLLDIVDVRTKRVGSARLRLGTGAISTANGSQIHDAASRKPIVSERAFKDHRHTLFARFVEMAVSVRAKHHGWQVLRKDGCPIDVATLKSL